MEDNIDYFGTKDYRIQLSQCDIDMLRFALNHIDWTYYDSDDFCGESADAAGIQRRSRHRRCGVLQLCHRGRTLSQRRCVPGQRQYV